MSAKLLTKSVIITFGSDLHATCVTAEYERGALLRFTVAPRVGGPSTTFVGSTLSDLQAILEQVKRYEGETK